MTQVFLTNASSSPWATPADFPTPAGGNKPQTLLLHFDGADASTTITDSSSSAHTFTANGNAQLDTADKKFGTAALLLDGTGDSVSGDGGADLAFGSSNDFTVHLWVKGVTNIAAHCLYDSRSTTSSTPFAIRLDAGFIRIIGNNATNIISASAIYSDGAWHHIAVTRTSGTLRAFFNGTQFGSDFADTIDYTNQPNRPIIGVAGNDAGTEGFNGWIDEVVVVNGESLWSSNFTAPSAATTLVERVNLVELVGCGGNGASGTTGTSHDGGSGGGAGAYRRRAQLTISGDIPFRVPAGGGGVTTRFGNDGSTGTNFFGAQFGVTGVGQSGGAIGGAEGAVTEETGGTPPGIRHGGFRGGSGGTTTGNNLGGGGGGGSAGPFGEGKVAGTPAAGGGSGGGGSNGGASTAGAAGAAGAGGAGGQGTSGSGSGAGGAAGAGNAGTAGTVGGGGGGSGSSTTAADPGAGGNGGSDTAYDATHGAGGGGGGCGTCTNNSARNFVSGNGGNYGGGGGGRGGARGTRASDTGGTGGGGLIVITYTPAAATPSLIFDPVAFFRPFIVR